MKKLLLASAFAVVALAVGQVSAHNHGGSCNEVVNEGALLQGPLLEGGTVCTQEKVVPETVIPAETLRCPDLQCPAQQCPDCVCKTCPVVECKCTAEKIVEANCPVMKCNSCATRPHKCHQGRCSSCKGHCSEEGAVYEGGYAAEVVRTDRRSNHRYR